jgi:hypothetical protein
MLLLLSIKCLYICGMLIDTEIFKTEKQIAEQYNKSQQSVNRSIKRANRSGKLVTSLKAFGTILYDIRTLPETITGK